MKWGLLAILLNIGYWSFSEKYIHAGDPVDGLLMGAAVSACCAVAGGFIGMVISK